MPAARFEVVMPLPQNRSRVTPLARTSYPASSAAMRPMSPPCVPDWLLVPQMMSSTVLVSRSLRSASAASTVAATRCGCRWDSEPLPGLPMPRGVRQVSMIHASLMMRPFQIWTRTQRIRRFAPFDSADFSRIDLTRSSGQVRQSLPIRYPSWQDFEFLDGFGRSHEAERPLEHL